MSDWYITIGSLCVGIPIAATLDFPPLLSGMFCLGINILILSLLKCH
jgi:hypothetical protein